MSLDCYPFGARRTIDLREQPIALDVAYDENLLITVVDNCHTIIVFDLEHTEDNNVIGRFQLGEDIVIDKVVYSKTGDYIVSVGHNNGRVGLYAALNWRGANTTDQTAPTKLTVEELNLRDLAEPFDEIDRNDKLNSIDVCQRTGNLAANYGDLVVIYQLDPKEQQQHEERLEQQGDQNQLAQQASPTWSATEDLSDEFDRLTLARRSNFKHLVSVKLAIWASRVVLCENYLSIMAMDHVQVLKLEVLTLQIQSDGLDEDGSPGQQQVNRSAGSSGESHHQTMAGRQRNGPGGAPNAANDTTVSDTVSASGDESSGSMVSGMTSNQSTRTNFSSFLATDNEEMLAAGSGATSAASASASASSSVAAAATPSALGSNQGATRGDELVDYDQMEQQQLNNATATTATDSDMSIITMNNSNVAELEKKVQQQQQQHQQQQSQLQMEQAAINSQDDCITWNLNTKKLVKLPTLMHNTSTDLSSFHICHPLELLGPASESIACRVSARIYSVDLSQNQLEPVVLLCKQFDFDRDPVKLVQLEAVYLGATLDEQKRLNRAQHGQASGGGGSVSGSGPDGITSVIAAPTTHTGAPVHDTNELGGLVETPNGLPATGIGGCRPVLLKSTEHELLASVCCFVSTLTNCFIYSLAAKKVTRLQTITHPGLCLDLRADLLNVYLLTPLGLQVCSTSICDATFRHDWSSAADLNLSFIACNRARVLATRKHLVMVSSSSQLSDWDLEPICQQPTKDEFRQKNEESCRMASFVEVLQKPGLDQLQKRIVQTVQCCQSISIRSNLLTYLQTLAQLEVIDLEHKLRQQLLGGQQLGGAAKLANGNNAQLAEARSNLKMVSLMLARQLLHKKQTNAITNSRIDKTIKHLLDNSFCDLGELMQRHLDDTPSDRTTTTSLNVTASPPLEARRRGASSACELDDELDPDKTFAGEEDEEEEEQDDDDDDDEQPADGNFELLKIYLRHTKFNPPILNYLKSLIQYDGQETKQSPAFNQVISYMFDYNPRLLIKCAQRITRELPAQWLSSGGCLEYLVEQLKQLVKLNSTGINRATVLFTLAILYHEMAAAAGDGQSSSSPVESSDREASGEPQNDVQLAQMRNKQQLQEQCLSALSQIKPLNHLAITMCSNHEIIGKSMAKLVNEHYPQVFKLFLNQLQKRDELLAASEFERLVLSPANQRCPLENGQQQADRRRSSLDEHGVSLAGQQQEDQDQDQEEEEEEIGGGDDEELFEQKLRLLAEISPVELAEFFCRELEAADQQQQAATNDDCNTKHCSSSLKSSKLDGDTMQAYLRASINLMESKFILARLCENSSR